MKTRKTPLKIIVGRRARSRMRDLLALTFAFGSLFFVSSPNVAQADRIDATLGAFSLAATNNQGSGSKSGPGAYDISYAHPILEHLDLSVGYTLIMSSGFGGDLGFGPNIGFFYFPISFTERRKLKSETVSVDFSEIWRPYAGLEFVQRSFQSTKASYAGFAMAAGCIRAFNDHFDLKGEIRYGSMTGPDQASAIETDLLLGISLPF